MADRRDTRRGDTGAAPDLDRRFAIAQMGALLGAAIAALALGDRDIAATLAGAAIGVAVPRRGAPAVAGIGAMVGMRWLYG